MRNKEDWKWRRPFIENIELINKGINYPAAIAKARGFKDSSPVLKQLQEMESMGLIKSKKIKYLNKTIFEINSQIISNNQSKSTQEETQ